MARKIFITIVFALILGYSGAQTFKELEGPFGANITNLFYDAGKTKLYAVANGKLFVSTDNAVNWAQVTTPQGYFISDALLDGTKLVALLNGRIQSTTDNGTTWTTASSSISVSDAPRTLKKLSGSGMYVALCDFSMLITVDGGANWKQILSYTPYDITDFDLTSNGDIFIADANTGIRKYAFPSSPNDLASWSESNWTTIVPKQTGGRDRSMGIAITSSDKIYIDYTNGAALTFQSSIDGGATWQAVSNTGFTANTLYAPVWSPSPNGKIYLFDNLGRTTWEYTEGAATPWVGKVWPTTTMSDQDIHVAVWKSNTQAFAGAATDGVFATSNTGSSWFVASTGLKFGEGHHVEITADGKIILVQGQNPKVYWYSTNQGLTWTSQPFSYPIEKLFRLPDNTLMMLAGKFVHTSTDGLNWTSYTANATQFTELVVIASNDIYGFALDNSVWESLDKGATWTQITVNGLPAASSSLVTATRDDDGYFYVSCYNQSILSYMFYKVDSNTTPWNATPFEVTSDPNNVGRGAASAFTMNGKIYVTINNQLFISSDKASTWKKTNIITYAAIPLRQSGGLTAIGLPWSGTFSVTQDDGRTFTSIQMNESSAYITDISLSADGTKYIASAVNSPALEFTITAANKLIYPPAEAPTYIDFNWQPVAGGPFGGEVVNVLKTSSDQLFAVGGQHAFRYNAANSTWEILNTPATDGYIDNTNTLYLIFDRLLYTSTDNGSTFTTRAMQPVSNTAVGTHKIIKNDQGDILVTSYNGLLRSTDNGNTFSIVATGNYGDIVMSSNGTLLVQNQNALLRSTDKGANWTPVNTFFDGETYIAMAALDGGRLGVITSKNIYLSSDDAVTWTSILGDFPSAQRTFRVYVKLFLSPSNEYWLTYSGLNNSNSLYVSTNRGTNWTKRSDYSGAISSIAWTSSNLVAGIYFTFNNSQSFLQSTNNGSSFTAFSNKGLANNYYSDIEYFKNKVYIVSNSKVFVSADKGTTWTEVPVGSTVTRGLLKTSDGNLIAFGAGLYKSLDGETWTKTNATGDFYSLAASANAYYATFNTGHIYFSNDLASWSEVNISGLPATYYSQSVVADNSGVPYFITSSTPYQLSSGTLTRLTFSNYPRNFVSGNGKIYLYDSDGYLFISSNGLNWTTKTVPRGNTFMIASLNYFYIDGGNGVLWLSRDQGLTWQNVGLSSDPTSLGNNNFREVIVDEFTGFAYGIINNKPVLKSSVVILLNDNKAPAIASLSPANNATNVLPSAKLTITFDEGAVPVAGKKLKIVKPSDPTGFVQSIDVASAVQVDRTFTFTPAPDTLKYSANASSLRSYFITLEAGAFTDLFGNATTPIINNTTWNFSMAVAPDVTPPVIVFSNEGKVNNLTNGDANKVLQATITDAVGVSQAQLFYRPITTNNAFTSVTMTKSTGNTYEATLPTSAYSPIGVEFYLLAADGQGNTARSPQTGSYNAYITFPEGKKTTLANALPAGSLQEHYRIISIPFASADKSVETILVPALGQHDPKIWRLLTLNSAKTGWAEYPKDFTTLDPGTGYWIIFKNGGTLTLNVESSPVFSKASLFSMKLTPGWNQIGNPYPFPLNWNDVLQANNSPAAIGSLKEYKGSGYNNTDVIQSTEGAFVYNNGSTDITLNIPLVTSASGGRARSALSSALDQPEWILPITLKNGKYTTNIGGIGMSNNSTTGLDNFDDFNPPRLSEFLQMEFAHPELTMKVLARDVVNRQEAYTWNFSVNTNLSESAELVWDNESLGENAWELYLFDVALQQKINMRATGRYNFNPKQSSVFRIYYGLNAEDRIEPDFITLGQLYPNPANQQTTIPFSLPGNANSIHVVSLEVYDRMGTKVSTAFDGKLSGGFHTIAWNSDSFSNGMYLCRLIISQGQHKITQTQKLMILHQ